MRIIAGEFRGRKLLPPDGDGTRPITDRVKQSVFDILSPRIEDAAVYDLFAGTGSMGLECLSRGCRSVIFFESHRPTAARLEKNVAALGVQGRSRIITADLFNWFANEPAIERRPDLIFLDPPYRYLNEKPQELRKLAVKLAAEYLSPGGLVVFRHDAADALELPGLGVSEVRDYGSMRVEFLIPSAPPAAAP